MSKTTQQPLQALAQSEHDSLEQWLHDELGQNLVAIKSFSRAILDKPAYQSDDSLFELATFINEIAASSYRSSYNLMQELRAQQHAGKELEAALQTCFEEAWLKEKQITWTLDIAPELTVNDNTTKAFILRCLRSLLNFSKTDTSGSQINCCISPDSVSEGFIVFSYQHQGRFDTEAQFEAHLAALGSRILAIGGELEHAIDQVQITFNARFPGLAGTQNSAI